MLMLIATARAAFGLAVSEAKTETMYTGCACEPENGRRGGGGVDCNFIRPGICTKRTPSCILRRGYQRG